VSVKDFVGVSVNDSNLFPGFQNPSKTQQLRRRFKTKGWIVASALIILVPKDEWIGFGYFRLSERDEDAEEQL